ncbi:hypothetical protein LCGC14_2359550 [marine sediment metagenome]|uniref:Uncharacterized protein n=1 Tax=marine sediment metagenome TaxID=412755 RepID=A0A0F9C779_9ZZZZ
MDKYKYVPKKIFEIYVGILKRNYRVEYYKSLLSEGSYVINLYEDYTEVSSGLSIFMPGVVPIPKVRTTVFQRLSAILHPMVDGFVRF